jgi:hypothetical protein
MKFITFILVFFCLVSCNDGKGPSSTKITTNSPEERVLYDVQRAAKISLKDQSFAVIAPSEINKQISTISPAPQPDEIIMLYAHVDKEVVFEGQNLEVSNNDLAHGWLETTLIHSNIPDDAIKARKVIMQVRPYNDSLWSVHSIREQYQCWPGRGHEEWSKEFCK